MAKAKPPEPAKPAPPTSAREALARQAAKRSPEQAARYAVVSARQAALQLHGIPEPASGTFGKAKS